MAAERRMRARLGVLLVVLVLTGCATIAPLDDLRRVASLAKVPSSMLDEEVAREALLTDLLARPLDPDTAVRLALVNNNELRARLHELGVARGRVLQAGVPENPTIEVELLPERDTTVEFRVEQELTSILLAPLRASAAAQELEATRYDVAGAVVRLGYEVRSALLAVVAAEQQLTIGRRSLDAFAATRDTATALVGAGGIPALEASTHVVAFERARVTTARLELAVAERRERLHRLLGLHGARTGWRAGATLPRLPARARKEDDPERVAIEASVELRALRCRLEALAQRTGIVRLQGWLPHVSLDVHGLSGAPDDDRPGSGRWRTGGGLSIGVPLFDRGQGNLVATEAAFDAAMQRYRGIAVDVRSAIRDATARLASAHARARQLQDVILPGTRRIVAESLLQYNAMQVDVFALLAARRSELDAELALVETQREYWTASAALDALLAGQRVESPAGARVLAATAADDADDMDQGGH